MWSEMHVRQIGPIRYTTSFTRPTIVGFRLHLNSGGVERPPTGPPAAGAARPRPPAQEQRPAPPVRDEQSSVTQPQQIIARSTKSLKPKKHANTRLRNQHDVGVA